MSRRERDSTPPAPARTQLTLLKLHGSDPRKNTDYLYCPVCRVHVPCRRIASGGWEVDCPGCQGECAFCHCHLKRFCFGRRESFPPFEETGEVPR